MATRSRESEVTLPLLAMRSPLPFLLQCLAVSRSFQWVRKMHWITETDLPLPSTGRGIEGEGWEHLSPLFREHARFHKPPLTPALSPLRGEGEAARAPHSHWCLFLRECR